MRIVAGLVCDQVRIENTGKLLVIGAYSGTMTLSAFPATVSLTVLVQIEDLSRDEKLLDIRFWLGSDQVGDIAGTVQLGDEQSVWLPIPLQPLSVPGPTILSADFRNDEGTWERFLRMPIAATPVQDGSGQ